MATGDFPPKMTVQQPPFIKMILLAVVLHALLGWQLWIGVAIVCLIPTGFHAAVLLEVSTGADSRAILGTDHEHC
jgi:hypothetical protein